MGDFLQFMGKVMMFLKMDISLYGFSFSFWDVFIWMMVTSIVISFIVHVSS